MPWAKLTYERTMAVYKEVLKDTILNNRVDYELVVKELLIRADILRHDFTKRQLNILFFVLTLSYTFGKEEALIPKLQDFELCGVSKRKAREEIDKLVEMNVLNWNRDENTFKINAPVLWDAPYNVGYNDHRSRELFLLNLKHAGVDVNPLIEKINNLETKLFLSD